jgi:DNA invertase Pin-like site-specific DNA recombinase
MDGVHIIQRIHPRGALLKVLDKPHLDLTTPIGRGFIAFLSALAEDERQCIVGCANAGRAAAKVRGVKFGRKAKLTDGQQKEARKRVEAGEAARAIARSFNVHHAAVLKVLDVRNVKVEALPKRGPLRPGHRSLVLTLRRTSDDPWGCGDQIH